MATKARGTGRSTRAKATQPDAPRQLPGEAKADMAFSKGWITVRMYRDILGDCFLLRFPKANKTAHVLIDCGILQGMPGAKERARRIMANIRSVTARLDVLVATHEHVDHLSGFAQGREFFDQIAVGELWLAWTEDPRDDQANNLRSGRSQAMALLQRSYTALATVITSTYQSDDDDDDDGDGSDARPRALAGLQGLMAFAGGDPAQPPTPVDSSTAGILDFLRNKAERVRFLSPGGETLALAGAADVSAYVLGPPRDETLLKKSNPSKSKPEVYKLNADSIQDDMFLVAALGTSSSGRQPDPDEIARLKLSLPFGFTNLIAMDATSHSVGARQDPAALARFNALYQRAGDEWRRVDSDWLGAAEQLALKLDSDTNNTSLALAIEIGDGPDSRVLLFPGDAQVGNWLSWGQYVWPPFVKPDQPGATKIQQLLSKTVLYKVGHHGSHNATLREHGLELMTHRDLVAMVPVQQEFANDTKKWNMPFPSLLKRLEERTGRRVIRADRSKADLEGVATERGGKDGELPKAAWNAFLGDLREISDAEGPIALEYRIAARSAPGGKRV